MKVRKGTGAESLPEQEQLLQLTHDSIFVRDMGGHITLWNRGSEKLYGWKAEEAVGKLSQELLKTVFETPLAEIEQQIVEQGRWDGELVHTNRAGQSITVLSRWVLQRDAKGKSASIVEFNRDITDRKRAEEALRRINQELEQRVEERTAELTRTNEELQRQQEAVRAFSTPVLKVRKFILIVPLVGILNAERAQQLKNQLLDGIKRNRARAVVIDLTGVAFVDKEVAHHLADTIKASELLGAHAVLTGISTRIAETFVYAGMDMARTPTATDLQSGIEEAEDMLGYLVTSPDGKKA